MYVSLLVWLGLVLPGYVVVRGLSADDLKSGLLGVVGLSYLATFALLSPVSIGCYLSHAPVWVFSVACVLAILGGAIEITRQGWWRQAGKLVVGGATIELLIVVVDMVMGARIGALTEGDAVVHLTRVRHLLDHGFSNYDPFVAERHFFPVYHTNLLHGLYATCAQLTRVHHLSVWFASLPWGKLLVASGCYYMVWCVYGRRWVGWVAAVFAVGCFGPTTFVIYPNKLAPLWIGALMIGFVVQACRSPCTWRSCIKLAAASLVIGQVHSLYGAFTGIALGPTLCVIAAVRFFRRAPDRWRVTACVVALGAALPFVLVSKIAMDRAKSASAAVRAAEPETNTPEATDQRWVTMGPRSGWGTVRDPRAAFLAAGIVAAFIGSRRKQAAILLAITGTTAMIFYVPPLCSAAVHVLGERWILSRMGFVLLLGFVGLVPASFAFLVEPKTRTWWMRAVVSVVALLLALPFPQRRPEYTWANYWAKTTAPRKERESYLEMTEVMMAALDKHIPRGKTVLIDKWEGMVLTMIHDCHIVASKGMGNGIPDLGQRRKDLDLMLAADTPWHTRRSLLRKYDIEYFVPSQDAPTAWTNGHRRAVYTGSGLPVVILDTRR